MADDPSAPLPGVSEVPDDSSDQLVFTAVPRPSRAAVYEALVAAFGNVSKAARELSQPRRVVQEIIDKTPEIQLMLKDFREEIVDTAEDNIFSDVRKGDAGASRAVVAALGKQRGWTTAVEGTGKNGAITVEITQFSEVPKDA